MNQVKLIYIAILYNNFRREITKTDTHTYRVSNLGMLNPDDIIIVSDKEVSIIKDPFHYW